MVLASKSPFTVVMTNITANAATIKPIVRLKHGQNNGPSGKHSVLHTNLKIVSNRDSDLTTVKPLQSMQLMSSTSKHTQELNIALLSFINICVNESTQQSATLN